ncbi:MAG: hypothetical protein Q9M94_03230 [Candidatus Gracilibacteria bacterium]|nr:hypothetical protein [Candidatus Gracilibacteria bacterium]
MNSILVENMSSKIIEKLGNKIDYNIFVSYIQTEKKEEKNIDDMTLVEYINSDEYKNENSHYYDNAEDFLSDLKKGI